DVTVAFSSPKAISDVSVSVGGQELAATSADGLSWTAAGTLGALPGGERLDVVIDHTTARGQKAVTVHGSTDGTYLYGSDESNLVDMSIAAVVNESGEADPDKAAQATRMLDGNASTQSSVPAVDGRFHLVWDFGEGASYSLERIDYLAAQNNNGMVRMPGLVFQGSDDLET
ncbi:hypothetical protein ADL26_07645, partial [Thermoactinomyces vulgaris]